ncbi:uncharacterized protein LOC127809333 [Diospyros lotus]|uniref:uncharacterized protein LOC127809333 n=1 Tax=Diospyros lotus TaxID=55363 RepID=UPI0022589235|nr:uncharacterized protein LOC127809333 [Diospyros lotus]
MAQTRSNRQTLSRGAESPRRETLARAEEQHPSAHEGQLPLTHGGHPPLTHGGQPSLTHQQQPLPEPSHPLGVQLQVPPLTTPHVLSGPYPGIQVPPVVPWVEYEALRQQHSEGMQALREMAGILQSLVPHGTIPEILRKFMPETVPSHRARQEVPGDGSYREVSPENHAQHVHTRNDPPRSPFRGAHSQISQQREKRGATDHRKTERRSPQRGRYSETVASTPMEKDRDSRQRDGLDDNPTAFSARETADMKKMIERVLQQNKLLLAPEEQSRGKLPFVAEVMEKPLPRKFKMP